MLNIQPNCHGDRKKSAAGSSLWIQNESGLPRHSVPRKDDLTSVLLIPRDAISNIIARLLGEKTLSAASCNGSH